MKFKRIKQAGSDAAVNPNPEPPILQVGDQVRAMGKTVIVTGLEFRETKEGLAVQINCEDERLIRSRNWLSPEFPS